MDGSAKQKNQRSTTARQMGSYCRRSGVSFPRHPERFHCMFSSGWLMAVEGTSSQGTKVCCAAQLTGGRALFARKERMIISCSSGFRARNHLKNWGEIRDFKLC